MIRQIFRLIKKVKKVPLSFFAGPHEIEQTWAQKYGFEWKEKKFMSRKMDGMWPKIMKKKNVGQIVIYASLRLSLAAFWQNSTSFHEICWSGHTVDGANWWTHSWVCWVCPVLAACASLLSPETPHPTAYWAPKPTFSASENLAKLQHSRTADTLCEEMQLVLCLKNFVF